MKIEWDRVTWYSKTLAVLVFIVTFFVGFNFGSIYQQAKDYSVMYPTTPPLYATHYDGMLICKNHGLTSGCPTGYSCMQPGPMTAGRQPPMVCVPNGQATPL